MIPVVNLVIGSQCWLCERNIFIVLITLRFTQTLICHLIWLVGRCIESGLSWVRSVCGQMEDVRDCESSIPDIRRLRPDTRRHSGHNGPSDTRRYPVTRIRLTCHTQWQWSSEAQSYIIDRDHINEIKIWRPQAQGEWCSHSCLGGDQGWLWGWQQWCCQGGGARLFLEPPECPVFILSKIQRSLL